MGLPFGVGVSRLALRQSRVHINAQDSVDPLAALARRCCTAEADRRKLRYGNRRRGSAPMSPALLRRVTHRRISPGQRHLAKQHWNQQRHTSKAVSGGNQRGSSPLCSTTQNPRYPCTRRHSAPGGADGEGSCDGVRRGVKSTWRATPVGCGARCLGSRETLRPKEQIAVWRLRSGPIQSIRLRLFAPSADACCSGGCGVGHEPASRALAWLPSRGACRRAHRDFMDSFGRE